MGPMGSEMMGGDMVTGPEIDESSMGAESLMGNELSMGAEPVVAKRLIVEVSRRWVISSDEGSKRPCDRSKSSTDLVAGSLIGVESTYRDSCRTAS